MSYWPRAFTVNEIRAWTVAVFMTLALCWTAATAVAAPTEIAACQTISQPGSYVLVTNLAPPPGADDCLIVNSHFVTIDLNGFAIIGNGKGSGVRTENTPNEWQGLEVRNGTVTNFTTGIQLGLAVASRIERVRAIRNGRGIVVYSAIVTDNVVWRNSDVGIDAYSHSVITSNLAANNGGHEIRASIGNTLFGNTAGINLGSGISTEKGNTVFANTTYNNVRYGISNFGPPCSNLIANTAFYNATGNISGCRGRGRHNLTP